MKKLLASVCLLLLISVSALARDDSNTANQIPLPNAAMLPNLQTFLGAEQPQRDRESGLMNFVDVSPITSNAGACIGSPGAGLTMAISACIAYNAGYRSTCGVGNNLGLGPGGVVPAATTADCPSGNTITFHDNSMCWVAMDENTFNNNAGLPNFTRVSGTHYLTDCTDPEYPLPVMPNDAQLLMFVVTSGGSIVTVNDHRNAQPFPFPINPVIYNTCTNGLHCDYQYDFGVTVTNGSTHLCISQAQGASFSPTKSVGQKIKIIDATTLSDQDIDTIATYDSASCVELTSPYPGTSAVATDKAEWGTKDATAFNALMTRIGASNTAGVWWPGIVQCPAPIIADQNLLIGASYNIEFMGTGDRGSGANSNTNENQNGCLIVDMNPTNGTNTTDIMTLMGDEGVRVHDFGFDPSMLYPKRGLIGMTENISSLCKSPGQPFAACTGAGTCSGSCFRSSVENRIYNVANTPMTPTQSATWGLTSSCVPAGNITGPTVICAAPPTGLNVNQYVYIFDSVTGFERKIVGSIVGSTINFTTALKATHYFGNYTIQWAPNIFALGGIYVENAVGTTQTDTNTWDNNDFQRVNTAIDNRQPQAVSSSIDTLVCLADIECVNSNGNTMTIRNVQQNDTSIGAVLDTNSTLNITNWALQPGNAGPNGIVAGTNLFAVCNGEGGFPTCGLNAQNVFWFSNGASLANGAMIQTSPGVQKGTFRINQLHVGPASGAQAPTNAALSPSIQLFMSGIQQSFVTDIDYDLGASAAGLNFEYLETGIPFTGTWRHIHLCPGASAILGLPPQCSDETLVGTQTFVRNHTDVAGHLAAGYISVPTIAAPPAPILGCLGGVTGTTWQFGATLCGDHNCINETNLANTATVSCNAAIDATHQIKVQVTTPVNAARAKLYRCPSSGTCATTAMNFQYVTDVGESPETGLNGINTPGKTGFVDNGTGVNFGPPPAFNMSGQIASGGLGNFGGLSLTTPLPTPGPTPAVVAWLPITVNGLNYTIDLRPGPPTPTPSPTPTPTPVPSNSPTPTPNPTQTPTATPT